MIFRLFKIKNYKIIKNKYQKSKIHKIMNN